MAYLPELSSPASGTGSQVGTSLLLGSAAYRPVGAQRPTPTVWTRSSFSLPCRQAAVGSESNGTNFEEEEEGEWETIGAGSTRPQINEAGSIPSLPRSRSPSPSSDGASWESVDLFDYTRTESLPAVQRVSSGLGVMTRPASTVTVFPSSALSDEEPPSPPQRAAYSPYVAYQHPETWDFGPRRMSNNPFLTRPARAPYVPAAPEKDLPHTPLRPQSHPAVSRLINSETGPISYLSGTSDTPTLANYDASNWSPGIRRFPQATPVNSPEGIELDSMVRRPSSVAQSGSRRLGKKPATDPNASPSEFATIRRNRNALSGAQYTRFVSPRLATPRFPYFTVVSNEGSSTDYLIHRERPSERGILPRYNTPDSAVQRHRGERICWFVLVGCSLFFPLLPLYFSGKLDEGLVLLTRNPHCTPSAHQRSIARFTAWLWAALLVAGAIIMAIMFTRVYSSPSPMLGMSRY